MATKHGSNASLVINSGTLTGYSHDATLSNTGDTSESTVFGLANKTYIAGLRDATFTFSGFYDPTASTGSVAIIEAVAALQAAVSIVFKPGGTASGQLSFTFNAVLTGYDLESSTDGIVTLAASFQVSGAITVATL